MSSQTIYWKQRNGELISIDNMDINHLRNVLKMIVKNSNNHKAKQEFKLNGDMASEFNSNHEPDNDEGFEYISF